MSWHSPRILHFCRTVSMLAAGLTLWIAIDPSQDASHAQTPTAQPDQLQVELSDYLVAVTTGFIGADVLLFGTIRDGGEIIAIVRGPARNISVKRKERVLGIWADRTSAVFEDAATYYAVASSQPLETVLPPETLSTLGIGIGHLRLTPAEGEAEDQNAENFLHLRAALITLQQERGLYSTEVGKIEFRTPDLFRTTFHFPSNVPLGSYTVEVLLVRNGEVVAAQTLPLSISKTGLGADVYQFAHEESVRYASLTILMGLFLGWIAYLTFRPG